MDDFARIMKNFGDILILKINHALLELICSFKANWRSTKVKGFENQSSKLIMEGKSRI